MRDLVKRFFQGLLLWMIQHPSDPDLIERDCAVQEEETSDG